jgi:hypothetical protein
VALQQHVVSHPTLRTLAPALLHRLAETLNALLPAATTLPDADGLQAQVERSGLTYEAKVADMVTKSATPAAQEALAHDLKGQLLELLTTLDQAHQQGDDVAGPRQQVQQALRNIEWQQLANLFAQQEHQSLLLQFLHPAFPTAHTARLYFRVDPRDQGSHQEDTRGYTLVFLLGFTALGHIRIDATMREAQVLGTIRTTDTAVADFMAAQLPTLTARLQALGFQSQLRCAVEADVPLDVEDAFTRLLLADPTRLLDIKT